MAKRAIARLEHWGLMRSFMAPHEDADMGWGDYLAEARARARLQGWKDSMLAIAVVRQLNSLGGIAPRGNRKVPVVWVEITEAGVAFLPPARTLQAG